MLPGLLRGCQGGMRWLDARFNMEEAFSVVEFLAPHLLCCSWTWEQTCLGGEDRRAGICVEAAHMLCMSPMVESVLMCCASPGW